MGKMKMYWSLYRHTTPSGKVYIGITHQVPEHRWNNRRGYMNVEKGPFKSSIIKYGWDNIKHEILFDNLTKEDAILLEKQLISHYKGLGISLNITDGGEGCHSRTPWNKGKKIPNMNNRKGIPLSEEHKMKLRKPHIIKNPNRHIWTEEDKLKASLRKKGTRVSEATRAKILANSSQSKRVLVEKNGETILFKSIREAANIIGLDCSWVARCCRESKICRGYSIRYADGL